MGRTTLSETVRLDGEFTTLRQLLDEGRAVVSKSDHFQSRGRCRVAYFVDIVEDRDDGVTRCFEVAPHVYNSRVK